VSTILNPKLHTAFYLGDVSITVTHEPCSDIGHPAGEVIVIREQDVTPDTLTRIEVRGPSPPFVVFVHWAPLEFYAHLGVLLIREAMTLFVGAQSVVAAVDLRDRRVLHQHSVFSFWGFLRRGNWVVVLGELDCFLYDLRANVLGQVPVDPPYEYDEHPEGFRFQSAVYGERWLRFPSK
jgi:hypothetical protein